MTDAVEQIIAAKTQSEAQFRDAFDKILAAAKPGAVFSEPVVHGNYTIITASQVSSGGGFGSGIGIGPATSKGGAPAAGTEAATGEANVAGGGGSGGGGGAMSRPVAAIVIGPDGVTVKPIVDVTRVALAAIATVTATLLAYRRVWRMMRKEAK